MPAQRKTPGPFANNDDRIINEANNRSYEEVMEIFLDRKGTKTINNRNIIGLNRMGRLKHRIKIFFGRSTKNFTENNL